MNAALAAGEPDLVILETAGGVESATTAGSKFKSSKEILIFPLQTLRW